MGRVFLILCLVCVTVICQYPDEESDDLMTKLSPGQITSAEYAKMRAEKGGRKKYSRGRSKLEIRDIDMILDPRQYDYLYKEKKKKGGRRKYKATAEEVRRWPNGVVPYVISSEFKEEQVVELKKAMETLSNFTCITFRPKQDSDKKHWVVFKDGSDCSSGLGMYHGGSQNVYLADGCRFRGLYLHEIGHALGLIHEHQRPYRNDKLKVIWRRVDYTCLHCFTRYKTTDIDDFNIPYDFSSIMHYEPAAFNKNKEYTMIPKEEWRLDEMVRVYYKTLSFTDTKVLNLMYKCGKRCRNRCRGEAYLDKDCNCITPREIHDKLCVNELPDEECYKRVLDGKCETYGAAAETNIKCRKACGSCPTYRVPHFTHPRLTRPLNACVDRYHEPERCPQWAAKRECERSSSWMKRNCRKSCNACDAAIGQCRNNYKDLPENRRCDEFAADKKCTENNPEILVGCQDSCGICGFQLPGDCEDSSSYCPNLAKNGKCDSDNWRVASATQKSCRKSCNTCFFGAGNCTDEKSANLCEPAAVKGRCRWDHKYHQDKCRKTCNSCSYRIKDPSCNDTYPEDYCSAYYENGMCMEKDYIRYALLFCPSSCNSCDYSRQPPCEDYHPQCAKFAAQGHCFVRQVYMATHCRKTCDFCHKFINGPCENIQNDAICELLREANECDTSEYRRICKRSCGLCEAPPIERFWECKDMVTVPEGFCESAKKSGQCEHRELDSKAFCHKTCGFCKQES